MVTITTVTPDLAGHFPTATSVGITVAAAHWTDRRRKSQPARCNSGVALSADPNPTRLTSLAPQHRTQSILTDTTQIGIGLVPDYSKAADCASVGKLKVSVFDP